MLFDAEIFSLVFMPSSWSLRAWRIPLTGVHDDTQAVASLRTLRNQICDFAAAPPSDCSDPSKDQWYPIPALAFLPYFADRPWPTFQSRGQSPSPPYNTSIPAVRPKKHILDEVSDPIKNPICSSIAPYHHVIYLRFFQESPSWLLPPFLTLFYALVCMCGLSLSLFVSWTEVIIWSWKFHRVQSCTASTIWISVENLGLCLVGHDMSSAALNNVNLAQLQQLKTLQVSFSLFLLTLCGLKFVCVHSIFLVSSCIQDLFLC